MRATIVLILLLFGGGLSHSQTNTHDALGQKVLTAFETGNYNLFRQSIMSKSCYLKKFEEANKNKMPAERLRSILDWYRKNYDRMIRMTYLPEFQRISNKFQRTNSRSKGLKCILLEPDTPTPLKGEKILRVTIDHEVYSYVYFMAVRCSEGWYISAASFRLG
ncbi:MAG: hypothetical protein AAFY71_10020 [Bacteroidota bacterium]